MKDLKKILLLCSLLMCLMITANLNAQVKKSITGNTSSVNNSSVTDYDIPANLKPGQEYVMTINMVNTGTNTWTMKDGYHLALYDNLDNRYMSDVWDVKQVALPYDVYPNQKVSFLFKVRAPYTAGMYNNNWAMTKDNEFFGEYNSSLVNVGGDVVNTPTTNTVVYDDNNSEFIEYTIPSTMVAGETYKVILTMKNTGKSVWLPSNSGNYRLVYVSDGSGTTYPNWNPSPVYFSQAVDPGQTSTIEFYVTAPPTAGSYNMQWMMQNGNSYFGQRTASRTVNVLGPNSTSYEVPSSQSYSSTFIDQTIPVDMKLHQEQKISVTMSNTGNRTWLKGKEQLVLVDTRMSPLSFNSWDVGYVQLEKDVPPGKLVTFEFNIKPSETGWQHVQFIMMDGEGTTFGSATNPVQVIVSK